MNLDYWEINSKEDKPDRGFKKLYVTLEMIRGAKEQSLCPGTKSLCILDSVFLWW